MRVTLCPEIRARPSHDGLAHVYETYAIGISREKNGVKIRKGVHLPTTSNGRGGLGFGDDDQPSWEAIESSR